MSELLREAMIVEARKWLSENHVREYTMGTEFDLEDVLADFVMHMNGQDGPELRFVEVKDDKR